MSSGYKMCLEIKYLICTYKKDLALNNLQWLIWNKSKLNQTKRRKKRKKEESEMAEKERKKKRNWSKERID